MVKDTIPILGSGLESCVLRFSFDVGYVIYKIRSACVEGNPISMDSDIFIA